MKKLSWRLKLVSLFMGILSLSLIVQIFYVIPYIRNQEIEKTKIHQEEIANSISRELDVGVNRIKSRLLRMGQIPEFRNMNVDAMQRIILDQEKISERISTIAVMNSEGWFVCGSMKDISKYTSKSYEDRSYFTIPFNEGKTYFIPPRYYAKEDLVSTSICIPIESESGDIVGVLIGGMDLKDLIERIAEYPLEEKQIACIVDKEGTVIAHSNIDLFTLEGGPLSLNYSQWPMVQAIMNGEKGDSQEYKHDRMNYFGTFSVLESNSWGVVVGASMKSILSEANLISQKFLLINLLLFAIALIITIIFARQITASQRKAEKMHMDSEERFRTIVESTPGLLMITDTKGKFTYISPNCEKLTGYTREELLNTRKWWVHEDDQSKTMELFARVINKGFSNRNFEFKAVKKNGELWHASSFWEPLKDNTGKVYSVVSQTFDITERKQVEEALKESERKYRYLFNILIEGIFIIDAETMKVVLANKAVAEIYGFDSEDDAIGLNPFELIPQDEKERAYRIIVEDMFEKDLQEINEFRTITKDGKEIWISAVGLRTEYQGRLAGLISIRDITECKRTEEKIIEKSIELEKQFKKSEQQRITTLSILSDLNVTTKDLQVEINERKKAEKRIKKSLKEKEILLQELYHRTKNNMQVICSILRLQASRLEDQGIKNLFKEIEVKINSMALVHQKLLGSKDLSHLDLKDYFNSLIMLFKQSYIESNKDISLHTDMVNINILIDTAVPLGLVFNELISNAIKHAFPGKKSGEIKVNLYLTPQNEIVLEVSDNGIGLPKKFDIKKDINLGLVTVIDLVESQLNGKINFKSRNGLYCKIVLKKKFYKPRI